MRLAAQRAVPGGLLVQLTRRASNAGPRLLLPLLLAYSIAITIVAVVSRGKQQMPEREGGSLAEGGGAAPAPPAPGSAACSVCAGAGRISWEGKWHHEDELCPRCLVSGVPPKARPARGRGAAGALAPAV